MLPFRVRARFCVTNIQIFIDIAKLVNQKYAMCVCMCACERRSTRKHHAPIARNAATLGHYCLSITMPLLLSYSAYIKHTNVTRKLYNTSTRWARDVVDSVCV